MTISCKKSGYNANIEFHTKPFYGGKKHRITGEIYGPSEKKPFITISGEWNGVMESKNAETGVRFLSERFPREKGGKKKILIVSFSPSLSL